MPCGHAIILDADNPAARLRRAMDRLAAAIDARAPAGNPAPDRAARVEAAARDALARIDRLLGPG